MVAPAQDAAQVAPPEWMVQQGGLFHGIQLWVNLPRDAKWNAPRLARGKPRFSAAAM